MGRLLSQVTKLFSLVVIDYDEADVAEVFLPHFLSFEDGRHGYHILAFKYVKQIPHHLMIENDLPQPGIGNAVT